MYEITQQYFEDTSYGKKYYVHAWHVCIRLWHLSYFTLLSFPSFQKSVKGSEVKTHVKSKPTILNNAYQSSMTWRNYGFVEVLTILNYVLSMCKGLCFYKFQKLKFPNIIQAHVSNISVGVKVWIRFCTLIFFL